MTEAHTGIGRSFRRKEDRRFLIGAGRFGDDIVIDGALHAVVVRSPHPHAVIEAIDTNAVRALPGVRTVLTGEDLAGEVKPISSLTRTDPFAVRNRDGSLMPEPDQPVLAIGKVRYVGEPVALVVADTRQQARNAADALDVDYRPLAAAVTTRDALADGAPGIWDAIPGNRSFDWECGDAAATDAAMRAAHHVTRVRLRNNRIAPVFLEPRTAIAEHSASDGVITLHTGSQTAHRMQAMLCDMLGMAPERLHVVTPDMGGAFGARGAPYPEMALVVFAARALERTVKWVADRSESFASDTQSRDHWLEGELAIDADGRFTALRVHITWRHGAYIPPRGIWVIVHYLVPTLGGVYAIAHGHVHIEGVLTNTTPLAPIRGVGRVESTYLIESLVDAAARELGMDAIALRRANMLRDEQMPWTAVGGACIQACSFEPHLDRALDLAGWNDFERRRAQAVGEGRVRGIGCAVYVENDGGWPTEYARLEVDGEAEVILSIGTQNFGMGHETVFAQIVMDCLGVPFESVRLVDGDTRRVAEGAGSHGSRSTRVGGTAIVKAADALVARARPLAGELLQCPDEALVFSNGAFRKPEPGPAVSLLQVAALAAERGEIVAGEATFTQQRESYSCGCHVCEVALDPDTGTIHLVRHVMVTDVGRAVNPMLVDGQVHGGAAQGIGQAAMEEVRYDRASGQLLTGSLMDYCLPRADDLPFFTTEIAETTETDNPLGVKGVGEGPTTGAPAAYMNAVRDALTALGAPPVDMPATSEKIWRAINRSPARHQE